MSGIGGASGVPVVDPSVQKAAEVNIALHCRMGQDLVQELVSKITDVFNNLKLMQMPNGTVASSTATQRSSSKIADNLKQIEFNFQKLRLVFNECQRKLPDDVNPILLIPHMKSSQSFDAMIDDLPVPLQKSGRLVALEQKKAELEAILSAKNEQLKKLLDETRSLVWETNSILALQHKP